MRAFHHLAAGPAGDKPRIAPAVQKQDALLPLPDPILQKRLELPAENRAVSLPQFPAQIHRVDHRKLPSCQTLPQGKKPVLSPLSPVVGLQGRGGGAQNHTCPVDPGHLQGRLSGMVLGRRLTFIAALVLLVHNDHPNVGKGGKKGGPGADNHVDLPVFGPLALVIFFSRRQGGVQDADSVPEPVVKPQQGLVGEGDLRDQHHSLPSPGPHLLHNLQIHFCLAASGDPVEKAGARAPGVIILQNLPDNVLLGLAQPGAQLLSPGHLHGIPQTLPALHSHRPRRLQAPDRLGGDAQFSRHPSVGNLLLGKQLLEKPLLGSLLPAPALPQQRERLLPAKKPSHGSVLQFLHPLPGGQHGLQRLYHGGTVIFPKPPCQGNHPSLYVRTVLYNPPDLFGPPGIEFADAPQVHHIPLQQPVAVSKGNVHAHSCLQLPPEIFRHPVLEGFIQFFLGNVHDHIRIKLSHSPPLFRILCSGDGSLPCRVRYASARPPAAPG